MQVLRTTVLLVSVGDYLWLFCTCKFVIIKYSLYSLHNHNLEFIWNLIHKTGDLLHESIHTALVPSLKTKNKEYPLVSKCMSKIFGLNSTHKNYQPQKSYKKSINCHQCNYNQSQGVRWKWSIIILFFIYFFSFMGLKLLFIKLKSIKERQQMESQVAMEVRRVTYLE